MPRRQTLPHFARRPHFFLIFEDRHSTSQPLLPARRFPSFFLLTITAPSVFLPAPLFCHPERSGGSTIAPAQSIRLFLSFRPRRAESPPSGEILRGAYQKTSAFTPPSASHDGESRRRSRRMRGVHFHVPPPLPSPHTSKRKLKTDGSLARHTIPRRNSRSRHHYIPCFRAFSSPPASFFLLS